MHGEKGNGGMLYKRYSPNMKRAVDYIEKNIKNNVAYSEVAQAAAISKGHFWRLYKMLFGETIGSYIRNRRLTITAQKLLSSRRKISDICYEYNFESYEAFSRAFKKLFKMAPAEYIKKKSRFYYLERQRLTGKDIDHILGGGINTNPDFVKVKSFIIYGKLNKITLRRLMSDRIKRASELEKKGGKTLTVYCGCGNDLGKISMDSPVEIFSANDYEKKQKECGKPEKTLPSGKYARFVHKGGAEMLLSSLNYIFGSWLKKSCKHGLKYFYVISENRGNGFRAEIYIPAGIIKKAR